MSQKMKVLQDLWIAFVGGYAGIPQDARHVFNALSEIDSIQVDGLFYAKNKNVISNRQPMDSQVERVLYDLLHDVKTEKINNNPLYKLQLIASLIFSNSILNHKYKLYSIDESYKEMLWQNAFEKTLDSKEKDKVLRGNFCYSDISWRDIMYAGLYRRKAHLNTEGYDFIIFPDVRAVSVSPSTKKIVRYHDSFAFLCPDFFQTYHTMMHFNCLQACVEDSYFVCDSDPTRDVLLNVHPEIEKKVFVVPPVVNPGKRVHDWRVINRICATRASALLLKERIEFPAEFSYMLALSTLEPRKNYINLIRAWENLCYQYNETIKLIIVANPGWLSEEIENIMRPHVAVGNIIHLNNVTSDEMSYLFSHATCFASLSYMEGFGIPPVEAMQCGCPVLASDNPTYRWSMNDAALYVDAYDVNAITEGMAQLVCHKDAAALRASLAKKGLERAKLYTIDNVKQQWEGVFDKLGTL
jgi:glycosyltransferase involved in cell wall biosynthesis